MNSTTIFSQEGRIWNEPKYIGPLLNDIQKQAEAADVTRSIDEGLISAIKKNDVIMICHGINII